MPMGALYSGVVGSQLLLRLTKKDSCPVGATFLSSPA